MKRSALFHSHQASGATFVDHQGWSMPQTFSSPEDEVKAVRATGGMADISYRAKFLMTDQPSSHWWRLGARRYLVIGKPMLDVEEAVDVTSVYANFLLAGPNIRRVLGKLTSLDIREQSLPNLSCAQANVAHVPCIVLREDLPAVPAHHLLVGRDFAESLWESILHAGKEFGLRPFGETALQALSV